MIRALGTLSKCLSAGRSRFDFACQMPVAVKAIFKIAYMSDDLQFQLYDPSIGNSTYSLNELRDCVIAHKDVEFDMMHDVLFTPLPYDPCIIPPSSELRALISNSMPCPSFRG